MTSYKHSPHWLVTAELHTATTPFTNVTRCSPAPHFLRVHYSNRHSRKGRGFTLVCTYVCMYVRACVTLHADGHLPPTSLVPLRFLVSLRGDIMVPPVQVSPLIKFTRYSALLVGFIYGKTRYDHLKPIAEEERRIETEEKAKRDEVERIAKELAAANEETILK